MTLLLLLASPAYAKTLSVGGSGSYSTIQSAINAANNGDTIQIAKGTYNEALDTKGKNLTLTGAGSGKVIVNASGSDSALTIDGGETVTASGMSFTGSDQGVNVKGSVLNGDDLELYGMTGDSAGGGFLVVEGAEVYVSECVVRGISVGNSAYGGAVFLSDSVAEFDSCVFKNNSSYQGGALYVVSSTLTLTDVEVRGNSSTLKGGGLQLRQGSDADFLRTSFEDNSSKDQGGGINIEDSDLACQNCTVIDNVAQDSGGGVAVDGALSAGVSFTGNKSLISGNAAKGAGGGLYVWNAKLSLSGELSDNTLSGANDRGAGLYFGKAKLTLSDLDMSGHSASDGGAVFVSNTANKVVVSGGTWSNNVASSDGGALYTGAPLTMTDTVISNNSATGAGGGVFVDNAEATLTSVTFSANSAGRDGGGLKVYKDAATIKSCTFLSNTAPIGAGYYHHALDTNSSKSTVTLSSFDSNVASTRGGGLAVEGASSSKIGNTSFLRNSPDGAQITGGKNPVVLDSLFRGNQGDGLVLDAVSGGRMERVKTQNNSGNGLVLGSTGNHTVYNSVFDGNEQVGLQILAPSKSLVIENCDAVDNAVGIEVLSGKAVDIVNTIAAFNLGEGFGGSNNTGSVRYSDAYGNGGKDWGPGWEGAGQLSVDPQYTGFSDDGKPTNNILFLGSSSPCRDSGDPKLSDADGGRSDMGAFGGSEASDKDTDKDGYKPSDGDCDESDGSVYPGAQDTWYDGVDSDCAGDDDYDRDGDGYRHESSGVRASKVDCDDQDKKIHPGAAEVEGDGIDSDCDGSDGSDGSSDTGPGDSGMDDSGDEGWWVDSDGDGYAPSQGDCDDDDASVNPGTFEVCDDGLDNDCDGDLDASDSNCTPDAGCEGCGGSLGGAGAGWMGLVLLFGAVRRRRQVALG